MISDETRYQEAGHALGAVKFDIGLADRGIEINSDEDAYTYIRLPDPKSLTDEDYCIRRAATKLAGPAAQLRFEKRPFTEQELESDHRTIGDLNEARRILQQYWSERGERNDYEIQRQLDDAGIMAHNAVQTHWSAVEAVVAASRATSHISAETIRSIVGPAGSGSE